MMSCEGYGCRYSTAGTKAFFLSLGEQCKEAALQACHPPEGKPSACPCCDGKAIKWCYDPDVTMSW